MRKDFLRDVVWSLSAAVLILGFLLGFSPFIGWLGRTFFGY